MLSSAAYMMKQLDVGTMVQDVQLQIAAAVFAAACKAAFGLGMQCLHASRLSRALWSMFMSCVLLTLQASSGLVLLLFSEADKQLHARAEPVPATCGLAPTQHGTVQYQGYIPACIRYSSKLTKRSNVFACTKVSSSSPLIICVLIAPAAPDIPKPNTAPLHRTGSPMRV